MIRKYLSLILPAAVIVLTAVIFYFQATYLSQKNDTLNAEQTIRIQNTDIMVEIADTSEKRTQGLSERTSLASDSGMLFIFEVEGIYPFWMKDMHFPIDIIWINKDFFVIDITTNISPDSFPSIFSPVEPIRYALEVNGGFSESHSITIGSPVEFFIHKNEF